MMLLADLIRTAFTVLNYVSYLRLIIYLPLHAGKPVSGAYLLAAAYTPAKVMAY